MGLLNTLYLAKEVLGLIPLGGYAERYLAKIKPYTDSCVSKLSIFFLNHGNKTIGEESGE